jgi:hypothetical protein
VLAIKRMLKAAAGGEGDNIPATTADGDGVSGGASASR